MKQYPYPINDHDLIKALDQTVDQKPLSNVWKGRIDSLEKHFSKRWHEVVTLKKEQINGDDCNQKIAIIGFACDIGVKRNQGRQGAHLGPDQIRSKLSNIPVAHKNLKIMDFGNIIADSDELERCQQSYASHVETALDLGFFPIGLGGGHEIAYASFSGLANHISKKSKHLKIGIINFDAHFDLRFDQKPSSGTPFYQIAEQCRNRNTTFHYCCLGVSQFANTPALFQRANELSVCYLTDEEMLTEQLPLITEYVKSFINKVDVIYLTICLDVFPAYIAPGVSAPATGGVSPVVIEKIIALIAASNKLSLADIAELNPLYDIDNHSAGLAARLIAKIVDHQSRNPSC